MRSVKKMHRTSDKNECTVRGSSMKLRNEDIRLDTDESCFGLFKTAKISSTSSMDSTENTSHLSSEDETISVFGASDSCSARLTESMKSSKGSKKGVETLTDGDTENTNPSHVNGIQNKPDDGKRSNSIPMKSVEFQVVHEYESCEKLPIARFASEDVYQQIEKKTRLGVLKGENQNYPLRLISDQCKASASLSKSEPRLNDDILQNTDNYEQYDEMPGSKQCKNGINSCSLRQQRNELRRLRWVELNVPARRVRFSVLQPKYDTSTLRDSQLHNLTKHKPRIEKGVRNKVELAVITTVNKISSRSKTSKEPKRFKQLHALSKAKLALSSRSKKSDEPKWFQRLFELSKAKQIAGKKRREDIIIAWERAKERSARSEVKISAAKAIRISTRMYDQAMKQRIALGEKIEASLTGYQPRLDPTVIRNI